MCDGERRGYCEHAGSEDEKEKKLASSSSWPRGEEERGQERAKHE